MPLPTTDLAAAPIVREMFADNKMWTDLARTTLATVGSIVMSFRCTYSGIYWDAPSGHGATLVDEGGGEYSLSGNDCWYQAQTNFNSTFGTIQYDSTILMRVYPNTSTPIGLFDTAPGQNNVIRNYGSGNWQWLNPGPDVTMGMSASTWQTVGSMQNMAGIGGTRQMRFRLSGTETPAATSWNVQANWTQPVIGAINLGGDGKYNGKWSGCAIYYNDVDSTTAGNIESHLNTVPSSGTTFNLSHSDTITFSESMTIESIEPMVDTVTFTELMVVSKLTSNTMEDTLSFSEVMRTVIAATMDDTLDFTESMVYSRIANKPMVDSLVFTEQMRLNATLQRVATDSLVFTETMQAVVGRIATMEDTLTFSEHLYGVGHDVSFGDTLVFTETMSKMILHQRTMTDTLVLNDTQSLQVNYSLQKFAEDSLVFKESLYVYKTRTGILLQGKAAALCLPSPEFNDFKMNQSSIVLHRSMAGSFRSYVKSTGRDKFNWKFLITKTQKDNLEYFIEQEINNTIIVNDWEGRRWAFKLVNDAFDFTETGRWARVGNKFEVTLEFEGVRYYG